MRIKLDKLVTGRVAQPISVRYSYHYPLNCWLATTPSLRHYYLQMRKLRLTEVKFLAQVHRATISGQARMWTWAELTTKPTLLSTASLGWLECSEQAQGPATHRQSVRALRPVLPLLPQIDSLRKEAADHLKWPWKLEAEKAENAAPGHQTQHHTGCFPHTPQPLGLSCTCYLCPLPNIPGILPCKLYCPFQPESGPLYVPRTELTWPLGPRSLGDCFLGY